VRLVTADLQLRFAALFEGRRDAYGTEEGGCRWATDSDIYEVLVDRHLETGPCLGVYPQTAEGVVHWGCVDFDEGDEKSRIDAVNLTTALAQLGVVGFIERSRSKGFHVWVFADGWVPAPLMRKALMGACQLVEAPIKEVNPKQESLPEGSVGNYVRLPYPGNGNPGRQVVIDESDGSDLDVETFVSLAEHSLVTPSMLEPFAELYVPPVAPPPPKRVWVDDGRKPTEKLSGLAFTIYKDGPLDGSDRSDTLWKLCSLMREECPDLTFHEALDLLVDADRRWGKFSRRANGEQQLAKMLSKAWGY
jgi:hypothetical protein